MINYKKTSLVAVILFVMVCLAIIPFITHLHMNYEKGTPEYVRQVAYESLSWQTRRTIIDWKKASVKEMKIGLLIPADGSRGRIDETAYKVTFTTTQDAVLGPIVMYINRRDQIIYYPGRA